MVDANKDYNIELLKYILTEEYGNRDVAEVLQQKVIQILSTAHMKINLYEQNIDKKKEGEENIIMVKNLILKSIHEINKLYFYIFPLILIDLGLIPALKQLFREFRKRKVLIRIRHIDIGARRTINNDLNVYKIIFILLNTIKKNIKNTSIEFSLIKNDSSLIVALKDIDGNQRFTDLLSLNRKDFLKKFIIFIERLKLVNGSYVIKKYPNKNREIIVKIPIISF